MPTLELDFAQPVTADAATRRLSGLAVPYGVASGPTRDGRRYRFSGPPENIDERVDAVREHDPDAVVGRLEHWTPADRGLDAAVRPFATTAGNDVLVEASEGVRPGFSVGAEADGEHVSLAADGVYDVARWRARHIGICRRPSFADAQITQIAASAEDDEHTDDVDDVDDTEEEGDVPEQNETTTTIEAVAQVPAERASSTGAQLLTFSDAMEAVASRVERGGLHTIMAALNDIVPADDTGFGYLRPQWLDEVWTPVATNRDFIESVNRQRLTSGLKVYGWQWDVYPTVDVYAGNKAPIPSSPAKTKPIEAPIERLAGGWDVDRIFVDLGSAGFLEALFRAAARDLAAKQEARVATQLLADATVPADPAPADLWAAVDLAARFLELNGASMSFVGISSDLWTQYVSSPRDEVPWWVPNGAAPSLRDSTGTAADVRFFANHTLPTGTVIAGDRQAVTFFEPSPNPIRVQAINIPNGGVDIALFSYQALLVNDARGLVKVGPGVTPSEPAAAAAAKAKK